MTPADSPRDMLGRTRLTSVAKARELLLEQLREPVAGSEKIALADSLDRVTAEPILAPEDLPPCDRSTMDGFAVVAADTYGASQSLPAYLSITGEVMMGDAATGSIKRGVCYRIPTGGMLPAGADGVVMLEHTVAVDDSMIEVVKGIGSGSNIIRKGEDIRQGQQALAAGQRLRPQDLGLLAGLGIEHVSVYKQIKVGIISTGDEIVQPGQPLTAGKIRNINSITIGSQARRCGAAVIDYGVVADTEEHFFATVERAVAETDLVLFSGGSSVGVRDLGEQAIERLAPPGILVHGVALKPGKPVIIGLCGTTPVFGLPGHPVSALVCFDFFVRPAILALSGLNPAEQPPEPSVRARLTRSINSSAGRLDVIRVQLSHSGGQYEAHPVLGRSGAISTLSRAHGYFLIDEDSQGLQSGSLVQVHLYL